jgi:hypothetical protein
MPLQATSGAASYDAFGGGVPAAPPTYIEDVFSTYLYTGNGSTQTITNGIDLAGEGGLVWQKCRTQALNNRVTDTVRGATKTLITDSITDEQTYVGGLTSFNSNGFSIGTDGPGNNLGDTFVSWTFREQPKFFDVVTYTGDGVAGRTVAHNLGSVPGCIMVKRRDASGAWQVYHRSLANTEYLVLNTTAATATNANRWNSTTPTSTVFSLGTDATVNASGGTYVAYLFAHDAGGFGLTGTDNVISCGSFTTDGSGNASVNLGYEPQWIMTKATSTTGSWYVMDNMRGLVVQPAGSTLTARLLPNGSNAEVFDQDVSPNATGFTGGYNSFGASQTYIYIAIRRGPMKVPTTGTSVFKPFIGTSSSAPAYISNFVVDMGMDRRFGETDNMDVASRLTGANKLITNSTAAETADGDLKFDYMTGYFSALRTNEFVSWMFRRAPSFFDEVCYTGTGSARTVSHNLQAVPELMIVKRRNSATYGEWFVYTATLGNAKYQLLNTTQASTTANSGIWNLTTPTSTVMSVGSDLSFSASPYVAYLFATCAGVSKCTAFTGNGTSQTINCGFTSGARFVMIKATSTTGNWTVFDSARGISAGGDPALYLNSTAAEVTGVDAIDADSTGFIVNQEGTFNLNASGVQYLVLAIA